MTDVPTLSTGYRRREQLLSRSEQETHDVGFRIAHLLRPGDVVAFQGHLGSGKTTCIRGVCAGLAVHEIINSPTFTLINEYRGRLPVYHFDFYRIQQAAELHDLGVADYFNGEGICLVEWPEVVTPLLPVGHRLLRFYHANEEAAMSAIGQAGVSGQDLRLIEVYQDARPRD